MAIDFLKEGVRLVNTPEGHRWDVIEPEGPGRAERFDHELGLSLIGAWNTWGIADPAVTRGYFQAAADRSRELYETIPTAGMTQKTRIIRGSYGVIHMVALEAIGDNERLASFRERFIADPLVPEEKREAVRRLFPE